jgi:hypothetical protein
MQRTDSASASPSPVAALFSLGLRLALLAGAGVLLATACDSLVEPMSWETDETAPVIVRTIPVDESTDVSSLSSITVAFNESVNAATVHHGTFRVVTESRMLAGMLVIHHDARSFTFVPDSLMPARQVIQVELRDIADLAGNRIAGAHRFFFVTGDPIQLPPPAPSHPSPADGATDVAIDTLLTWQAGVASAATAAPVDSVVYDVWLGPDPGDLAPVAMDLAGTSYAPGHLLFGVTYSWQVVARSPGGESESPIWSFSTEPWPNRPPTAPSEPITPANTATSATADVELTWSGGDDPDEDPVTYLVRLGTSSPPPDLGSVAVKSLALSGLGYETIFYWQVVADDGQGHQVEGPVWSFRTPDTPPPPNDPPDEPRDPVPANGAEVPAVVSLTWSGGDDPDGDDVWYVVYLEANDLSSPDSVAVVYAKEYAATLDHATTYFWRIEARDSRGGVSTGPIWFFTTEELNLAPTAPCDPTPADGAINVWIGLSTLAWGCGVDPEGDGVEFDVYFGLEPDPPYLASTTGNAFQIQAGFARTYYWRVVARDNRGASSSGPTWMFKTIGANETGSPGR